jgi:hypothetical protein
LKYIFYYKKRCGLELATVILMLLGVIVLVFVGGGIIAYFAFAVPAIKSAPPLSEEDREACRRLIKEWKAYPFLCRSSVRKGACPCQPCPKLNAVKVKRDYE